MGKKKNIVEKIKKYSFILSMVLIASCLSIKVYAQEDETEDGQVERESEGIELEIEEADQFQTDKAKECYVIPIAGVKNYDMVHEILEYVNGFRVGNGGNELVLDEALVEECMLYGAEYMVGCYEFLRPNGMKDDMVLSSHGPELPLEDLKLQIVAYATNYTTKDSCSIGIGYFYDGTDYHLAVKFSDKEGIPLKKTGMESVIMNVEIAKEWTVWTSNERNVYLKCDESKTLGVEVGRSSDGVYVDGKSVPMSNQSFQWESDDTAIAEVTPDGKVIGKKSGSTTIAAFYDGKEVYRWNVRIDATEGEINECVTIKVSGTRHYEYVNQALKWINEWRAKEGLGAVTFNSTYNDVVWKQAVESSVRYEKSPSTGSWYSGTLSYSTNGCGYGAEYYRWMHDTSYDVLNPNYKSVAIACFQQDVYYSWSIIWSEETSEQQVPTNNVYVHEDVSILKDRLAYKGEPAKTLNLHPGESEQLTLYQGYIEDDASYIEQKVLVDHTLLKWESSDSSIASVSANGNVAALKHGTVKIIASYNGGVLFQWDVHVKSPVTPKKVQVTYTGTHSYTEFQNYKDGEYYEYFTVIADGEELSENDFYIVDYGINEDDSIEYLGFYFQGNYKGNYTFYLKDLNKVNAKAVSAGKNRVTLSWKEIEDAEGYLIYAQKNGVYGYVGNTYRTYFTDTKALDTEYNFYWVFPYRQDNYGKMYPGGCEKYVYAKGVCPAVTNLKASSVSGGVKLSWSASAGAEGYLIYGIENGGSYGYVGMTTKGTTFTAKKASKTQYNFYWIFPYHKNVSGKMITGGVAPYTYGRAK